MVTASYSARNESCFIVTLHQQGIQLQNISFSFQPSGNAAASWLQSHSCSPQPIKKNKLVLFSIFRSCRKSWRFSTWRTMLDTTLCILNNFPLKVKFSSCTELAQLRLVFSLLNVAVIKNGLLKILVSTTAYKKQWEREMISPWSECCLWTRGFDHFGYN